MRSWSGSESSPAPSLTRLQVLWTEHLAQPYPPLPAGDRHAQEIAFYASWVGSLVEAALAARGRLDADRRLMLEVRRREGNQAVWAAAGELGEPARAFVGRLFALEDLLAEAVQEL